MLYLLYQLFLHYYFCLSISLSISIVMIDHVKSAVKVTCISTTPLYNETSSACIPLGVPSHAVAMAKNNIHHSTKNF